MIIADIIQILILITLVITAYFALKEIRQNRKIHEDTLRWNKMNKTKDALDDFRNTKFPLLAPAFRSHKPTPGTPVKLQIFHNEFEKDSNVYSELTRKLNLHEGIARGIKLELYDEEMIKMARRTSMTQVLYENIEYIKYRREISNKYAWASFEKLIKKWESESKKENEI